jgi:hypothetical protein
MTGSPTLRSRALISGTCTARPETTPGHVVRGQNTPGQRPQSRRWRLSGGRRFFPPTASDFGCALMRQGSRRRCRQPECGVVGACRPSEHHASTVVVRDAVGPVGSPDVTDPENRRMVHVGAEDVRAACHDLRRGQRGVVGTTRGRRGGGVASAGQVVQEADCDRGTRVTRPRTATPTPFSYWYAQVPFEHDDGAKERPVLVLRVAGVNARVLKVTSKPKSGRTNWRRVDTTGWDRPGQREGSWLQTDKVTTVPVKGFRRCLGLEHNDYFRRELVRLHPTEFGQPPVNTSSGEPQP